MAVAKMNLFEIRDCLHLPGNSRLVGGRPQLKRPAGGAAVFLDRDGVIVEDVHFLRDPAQLRILPGVARALRLLQTDFYLIVVSNQSGIARGFFSEADLAAIHTELVRKLAAEGAVIDALYYCPHLPQAPVEAYAKECQCRKPSSGMLVRAQSDWGIDLGASYMIGDRPRDIEAGLAAGLTGLLLGAEIHSATAGSLGATDLLDAARQIMGATPPRAAAT